LNIRASEVAVICILEAALCNPTETKEDKPKHAGLRDLCHEVSWSISSHWTTHEARSRLSINLIITS